MNSEFIIIVYRAKIHWNKNYIEEYPTMLHKVMKLNLHKITSLQNIYHTCCYSVIVPIKHDLLTFFQQNLGK